MKLTPELIAAAIEGYEAQKARIDGTIAELRAMLTGGRPEAAAIPEAPRRKRRKMSAAARQRIAEAQRKRWAAKKAPEPEPEEPVKPKRKLSRAGRAAIIAATKKRWAAVRAAKAQGVAKKSGTKKVAKKAPVVTGAAG